MLERKKETEEPREIPKEREHYDQHPLCARDVGHGHSDLAHSTMSSASAATQSRTLEEAAQAPAFILLPTRCLSLMLTLLSFANQG